MRLLEVMFLSIISIATDQVAMAQSCNSESVRTEDITECAKLSYSKIDAKLNEQYKILADKLQANQLSKLRDVQRTWIAYKDSYCGTVYKTTLPGKEAEIEKYGCLTTVTKARLNELIFLETGVHNDGFNEAIEFITTTYAAGDRNKVIEAISKRKVNSEFDTYAEKNCRMINAVFSEEYSACTSRMRFQTLLN